MFCPRLIAIGAGFLTLLGQSNSAEVKTVIASESNSNELEMRPGVIIKLLSHNGYADGRDYPNEWRKSFIPVRIGADCKKVIMTNQFMDLNGTPLLNCFAGDYISFTFINGTDSNVYCGKKTFAAIELNNDFGFWFATNRFGSGKGFEIFMSCASDFYRVSCKCGVPPPSHTRILGGQDTEINEYPWHAGIIERGKGLAPFCGATILSDQWIITAAHCLRDKVPEAIEIVVGEHDTSTYFETADYVFGVKSFHYHPKLNTMTYNYDAVLLKLDEKIVFNDLINVRPICFPTSAPKTGDMVLATGWGRLGEDQSQSSILQELEINVISSNTCQRGYEGLFNPDSMFCAGDLEGKKDTCQGDSGGPLIKKNGINYELVGLVSWGEGCGRAFKPGVYANVKMMEDWWKSLVGEEEACPRE